MVLAERSDNLRNGRRSRGPSPNGHGTPDSSSDDENASKRIGSSKASAKTGTYEAEKIRVGRDYQAVCPEMERVEERKPELVPDRALLVWSPTKDIPDQKLEEYITVAKDKYGYNGEQALGMLFWHKHDLERAVLDLANFTPFPDEWTVEDRVLFEQAFQFHGKSFHRIRQMLPDKSIASLVKYYYGWKKSRSRSSLMDRQAKKLDNNSENNSEHSNEDSDNEEKAGVSNNNQHVAMETGDGTSFNDSGASSSVDNNGSHGNRNNNPGKQVTNVIGGTNCEGCGVQCTHTHIAGNNTRLCQSCYHHWRRTGKLRPTSGPLSSGRRVGYGATLNSRVKRLPKGMQMNHDDLLQLAKEQLLTNPNSFNNANGNDSAISRGNTTTTGRITINGNGTDKVGESLLLPLDREITSLRIQVQSNKQIVGSLKRKINETGSSLEELRGSVVTSENSLQQASIAKANTKWTNDELLLAVQGVRKYGKDFQAIAEAIGTKTEAHVKAFFVNYRRRYNLDTVLRDYEQEKGTQMEVESESTTVVENKSNENSMEMMK